MCRFLGLISKDDVAFDLYNGLLELQHGGQDSAGFVTYDTKSRELFRKKGVGLVTEVIRKPKYLDVLKGNWGIAQVRYPTVGANSDDEKIRDAQPTYVTTPGIAMAHNGNVINVLELRNELRKVRRYHKSNCDIETINLLLAEEMSQITDSEKILEKEDFFEATKKVMEKVKGAYSVVGIIRDFGFFAFRDPSAIRPFVIGVREHDNSIAFASENVAFEKLGYKLLRDIKGGEAVFYPVGGRVIDDLESRVLVEGFEPAHCMFEYVYFARPASTIEANEVYQTRFNIGVELGKELMKKHPDIVEKVDVVFAIPDSPRPMSDGLAEKINKPHREGFDKNRYSQRTFIGPDVESRKKMVKSKLSPIKSQVKGKKVLIVDDSIVRANTSPTAINLLKEAGAEEVYVVIGSPELRYPCQFGVDIVSTEELIAASKTREEIREFIGADFLYYLSLDGLKKGLGDKGDHCFGCLNKEYPLDISLDFSSYRTGSRDQ